MYKIQRIPKQKWLGLRVIEQCITLYNFGIPLLLLVWLTPGGLRNKSIIVLSCFKSGFFKYWSNPSEIFGCALILKFFSKQRGDVLECFDTDG